MYEIDTKDSSESDKRLALELVKRYDSMENQRVNWTQHWQELAYYVMPRKDDIYKSKTAGEKKGLYLYDSTAHHAAVLLASALHSMLTNPVSNWFNLCTGDRTIDELEEVIQWYYDTENTIHQVLLNSNFHSEIHEAYLDIVTFGTGPMLIEKDEDFYVRFQARPIYECYLDENNKGRIDTLFRKFEWTLRQIVQQWGIERLPEDLQRKYKEDSNCKHMILQAIYPREDYDRTKIDGKNKKFASVYVLCETKTVLSEHGFDQFPYITPRWSKLTREIYGRSPAMGALPDIKLLNEVKKVTIKAAQKTVDPPVQVPDDGMVLPVKLTPGSTNYYRAGTTDRIELMNFSGRVDIGRETINDLRNAIREGFFIDQLQLSQGPQMTATEVIQRTEEKLRILGPVLGRMTSELLQPLLDKVFTILLEAKRIKPIPQALSGKNLEVRFSSAIAKAQKTTKIDNLTRVLSLVAPIAQMDQQALDKINADETIDFIYNIFELSPSLTRKDADVKKIRSSRAQAQQQAAQDAQNAQNAQNLGAMAPALKQIPNEGVSGV